MTVTGPYVGFLLGGVSFALDAARVLSVAAAAGVIPVPFARACVAGVLVRQGRLVPVVDLALVTAIWNIVPPAGGEQVLVLGSGEIEAGFLASAVETFKGAAAGTARDFAPSEVREAILCGSLRAGDRTWGLLRVDAALAAAGLPAQVA